MDMGKYLQMKNLENDYNFTYQLRLDPKLYLNNKVEIFNNKKIAEKILLYV